MLDEKKLVYFGPQTTQLLTLINLHPHGLFFGRIHFGPYGVLPLKFLHALQIDQVLLAHTRRWTWVPPQKKNNRENLKFSVLESITSDIMEVFSLNFFMRPAIAARGISTA